VTYPAQETCKIETAAKGQRRIHEQGTDGRAVCAAHNVAAASHDFESLGPGDVDCQRCARMTCR
jgi:hypothetical protein